MKVTEMTLAVGGLLFAAEMALATTWDLASEYPASSLGGQAVEVFAKSVSNKTDGEFTIVVHHGGALGYKSIDQFDAVGDGALLAASTPFGGLQGLDPIFQLSSLPFLAPDKASAWRLYEIAKDDYAKVFEDNGQIFLFATAWPSAGLWGHKAFTEPGDLKGVKIRTFDPASTETIRNVGAIPIQMTWADVPAQLSSGGIEAVLTSANGGVGVQLWDQQSHFTAVNYAASLVGVHINASAWQSLSDREQAALLEAASEAEKFGWNLMEESVSADYKTMRDNGGTVVEEVSADFGSFLSQAGAPFVEDWKKRAGDRAERILNAYSAN